MERSDHPTAVEETVLELPPLFKYIDCEAVAGFDEVASPYAHSSATSPLDPQLQKHQESTVQDQIAVIGATIETQPTHKRSVSVSMPSSPTFRVQQVDDFMELQPKFHSIPMPIPHAASYVERKPNTWKDQYGSPPARERGNLASFQSFKNLSRKYERQLSLRIRPEEEGPFDDEGQQSQIGNLPVDRYFDALEGPELDTLKVTEDSILPTDQKWPFLLRFPISSFGICLGLGSQAILYKTIASSPSMKWLHGFGPNIINIFLWFLTIIVFCTISTIYLLKVRYFIVAVHREYYHPIRVNFFFAPWVALLFMCLGSPPSLVKNWNPAIWYILMTPILGLELKIYGQWMSGGTRRLSKVANPSNHLSVVGNFVGALLGASMGIKEAPLFFFAVGLAHYAVLFVTLYQRLPTNETLPKDLHPVFFLFVAAPSVASVAWARIQGEFDYVSRISLFIALFLYFSLVVRLKFFWGFNFSIAWWAYTFPMTGAAVATIKYSDEVKESIAVVLASVLALISSTIVTLLLCYTFYRAFIKCNLYPNDTAIAIDHKARELAKKHPDSGMSDHKDTNSSQNEHVPNATSEVEKGGGPTYFLQTIYSLDNNTNGQT